jgi:exodeoxyribonuclease X
VPQHICTLKLAHKLDTEGHLDKHALQYLRYAWGFEIDATAHDALGDVLVLEKVFLRIQDEYEKQYPLDPDETVRLMIKHSSEPVLIARVPFGKHRGTHFNAVPKSYLNWMLSTDLSEDLKYTAKFYLNAGTRN